MSEATIAAVTQPIAGVLGRLKVVEGSCGVLLPGMEAKILDELGRSVEVREVGELWLKSENISPGYYGSSPEVVKANRETFVDGWLRTGDRFYVDEDENFLCVYFFILLDVVRLIWSIALRTVPRTH